MLKIQRHQQNLSTDDSGFTIIESLIGIVIVAVLLASISPVFVMSTAIRVQAKRIEKSAQVANSFIDGIRSYSIPAPGKIISLAASTSTAARSQTDNLFTVTTMPLPVSSSASSNPNQDFYLAKKDGNICLVGATGCTRDTSNPLDEFYIQAAQIKVTGSALTNGYRLGIRVYRADINLSGTVLASASNTNVQATDSSVTSGLGNKQAPIIERTVDISGSTTTFQSLCARLGIAQKKDVSNVLQNQNCPN
ncbi:hormogonium polysaccharide secretion pseudopilin HpsB [Dolichospermum sp. ST_con]|nr:hormogonium polysaccharide secretion pseudopilin HpsB [Dolichospermum sp. ST_con]MDD1419257.1 hormogonium polysaccharide secretion pseudopilin HpsB [Dolichospermum sp. ST_sed1]MDD1424753.1 hormogonium polysaccharide secretion pseudopilin HpsB [Dolichospermum sp. ST_sed9]MDD1432119.1 hormogonium polysaccharide secretion pseudopilin HpsB [Dolichospermum sp. ST_sed6]MDD1436019.1 hormogonium polysaccharide secretion pseudopilin HpsB [Dolichospermum sp. ST_sed10]MDD1440427.1 hormogonium polysacc